MSVNFYPVVDFSRFKTFKVRERMIESTRPELKNPLMEKMLSSSRPGTPMTTGPGGRGQRISTGPQPVRWRRRDVVPGGRASQRQPECGAYCFP